MRSAQLSELLSLEWRAAAKRDRAIGQGIEESEAGVVDVRDAREIDDEPPASGEERLANRARFGDPRPGELAFEAQGDLPVGAVVESDSEHGRGRFR
jgi:hypothetical protein